LGLSVDRIFREFGHKFQRHFARGSFSIERLPDNRGPGNALLLETAFERVTEIVAGFGKLRTSAESLAKTAATRISGCLESPALRSSISPINS
jgi:RNA 3'-terminal phosphate cyclase